jgi:hypothetical protein
MHVQSGTPVAIKEVSSKVARASLPPPPRPLFLAFPSLPYPYPSPPPLQASSVESEDQIEVWAQVRHENIIRLLDFHRTEDNLCV